MSNPYQKLASGAKVTAISITAYDALLDMLNQWQTQKASGDGAIRGLADWNQGVFQVKNGSGATVWTGGVLGITGPLYGPTENLEEFLNRTPIEGAAVDAETHAHGKWCVALEPIAAGAIGRCCLAGVVPARVYVTADGTDYCDAGAARLETGLTGARVLWLASGSVGQTSWALVRPEAIPEEDPVVRWFTGVLPSALKWGDASVAGVTLVAIDGKADPTETVTLYNANFHSGPSGQEFLAYLNLANGHYEIATLVWMEYRYYGTLPAAMASSDTSISAVTLTAINGVDHPSGTKTVYNVHGLRGGSGKKFTAVYNANTGHYEFEYVQPLATIISGTAPYSSDPPESFLLDSPAVVQPVDGTLPEPTDEIEVYNVFGWTFDDETLPVYAFWNQTTGQYEAIFGNGGKIIGKLNGSLSQGGSAAVSVWGGTAGSEADTGLDISVRDWLMKTGADAIASGKKVVCEWINNAWYVTEAECP